MKIILLRRVSLKSDGTYGVMLTEDKTPFALTLELPWLNNQQMISCVPKGEYICKRVNKIKMGECWELQNVPNREYILIHRANFVSELRGCIAMGEQFEDVVSKDGKSVITSIQASGKGFSELMQRMVGQDYFKLVIEEWN